MVFNFSQSGTMPEMLERDSDPHNAHAKAWWTSTGSQFQQSCNSRNLSFKMATPPKPFQHEKDFDFQVHELDSPSTHSTGHSYSDVACVGERKNAGTNTTCKESGHPVMQAKSDEDYTKSTLSSHDYTSTPDHGGSPFTCPTTFWPGILAAYAPHAMVHSQMECMASTRLPLPLGLPHEEPVYVNAKQYGAILRRRQYRAKLEAQNKVLKARKPYLHESRHRHALNRTRGPGGRFLNIKKLQQINNNPAGGQDNSGTLCSQSTKNMWGAETRQLETCMKSDPASSPSEITSSSNVDNHFHPQEFGFSFYVPNGNGGPIDRGGGGISGGMQHYLSVSR